MNESPPGLTRLDQLNRKFETPASRVWLLALSMVAAFLLYRTPAMYPFKLFATWVHEMGHGLTAIVLGGDFERLTIATNTAGLATYRGNFGRLSLGLVASAGYLGTAGGGALLLLAAYVKRSQIVLLVIGAAMALSAVLFVRNLFGFIFVVLAAGALIALGYYSGKAFARVFLTFLAATTGLNSVMDIWTLWDYEGCNDAKTMSNLFLLPAGFWVALWVLIAVGLLALAIRLTWFGKEKAPLAAYDSARSGK